MLKLMNLVPYEKFIIHSKLLSEEIIERIEDEIEPTREIILRLLFSKLESNGYFSGSIFNSTFSLTPVINYRNSFIPHITGSVKANKDGCVIKVKMAPNTAVIVSMCIWMGCVVMACIRIVIKCIVDWWFDPIVLVPFGIFLFGYTLMTGAFKFESGDARRKLLDISYGVIEE